MAERWTEKQLDAIQSTAGSVLVSAAAGSGKTSVLSERVIRLITRDEDPVPANRLLVATFTRDAAAEMKKRITDKLNSLLEDADAETAKRLIKQKQLLYSAQISTIDSYCKSLICEYFHVLEIPSDFRIADESEKELLRNKALDSTLSKFYEENSEEFKRMVSALWSKYGDSTLRGTVLAVDRFLECVPIPDVWLDEALEEYDTKDFPNSLWGNIVFDYACDTVDHLTKICAHSLEILRDDETLNSAVNQNKAFENGYAALKKLYRSMELHEWDNTVTLLNELSGFLHLPSMPRKKAENETQARNRNLFKSYKSEIPAALNDLKEIFSVPEDALYSELSATKPVVETLFNVVKAFEAELFALKLKRNVFTFSDNAHLAVKLLAGYDESKRQYIKTPLADEISRRYDAVIVDEYQDVNAVQNLIFDFVSREDNLFVVGDVKQSIYTFRQTRPDLFMERRDSYRVYDREKPVYPATVFLDKNFRSRVEVCDTVNFIFRLLMSRKTADIHYTTDDELAFGAEQYGDTTRCATEIVLIDSKKVLASAQPSEENPSELTLEARFIARKILEMQDSGFTVTDRNGNQRPLAYGDIAILMRATGSAGSDAKKNDDSKKGAAEIIRVLGEYGISAYAEQGESFFNAREIKILMNFLRTIDNPLNDIPLLSVLISPIYGFTPDELAVIRANDRYSNLYEAVRKFARGKNSPKANSFLVQLAMLRQYASSCTVDELLGKIYDLTALNSVTAAVNGGGSPMSNLNLMRVYARGFESNGYKSLSDFVGYIDRLTANAGTLSSAPKLDSGADNRVRIMTIHKAKGLEFPVCFLADTTHGFNKTDFNERVLMDEKAKLGLKLTDGFTVTNTLPRKAVEIKKRHELVAEEMRLLYVALTRAREKLIITASVSDVPKHISRFLDTVNSETLDSYVITGVNNMFSWIMYAAAANPVTRAVLEGNSQPGKIDGYPDWRLEIVNHGDRLANTVKAEENASADALADAADYAEILKKNLNFRYPNKEIMNLPQKVTASEISHSGSADFDAILYAPDFIDSKELSATERGTAHHEFLRYCDFSSAKNDINSEIEKLVAKKSLTQKQADSLDIEKLTAILSSDFFTRVSVSDYYREKQFTVEIPPRLIDDAYLGIKSDAGCIMQGAVDLVFIENGELVIADYKTDHVSNPQKLVEMYRKQLELYQEAMQQVFGMKVKELYIFSIYQNRAIKIDTKAGVSFNK